MAFGDRERRTALGGRLFVAGALSALAASTSSACSEGDGGESGGSAASSCKAQVALDCYTSTYDQCLDQYRRQEQVASEQGCSSEWAAALECVSKYPSSCRDGRVIVHTECSSALLRFISCSDGGFIGCDESDPCVKCTCERCPCDNACIDAFVEMTDCFAGCEGRTGEDLIGCMNGCNEAAPAPFRDRMECVAAAEKSCTECVGDGGS